MLKGLFGPNIYEQFTLKKNQDLVTSLASKLVYSDALIYADYLSALVSEPDFKQFYTREGDDEEGRNINKTQNVQVFALNQLNQLPQLCRSKLEDNKMVDRILQCQVQLVMSPKAKGTAFSEVCFTKFASFLLTLTKVRGQGAAKGERKEGQLWAEFACQKVMEHQ